MTQDEIMELAEQADLADKYGTINYEYGYRDEIIAFAKLVAAKERQWLIDSGLIGVLKHCEDLLREDGHDDAVDDVQNMIAKIKTRAQA